MSSAEAARAFAEQVHAGQVRKGDGQPFIVHPQSVADLVARYIADEEVIAAAWLHDAAEDGGGEPTLEAIREAFGGRVAGIVAACSDTFETPKPRWRPRKERFVESLRSADSAVKLVVAADKTHNAKSLAASLQRDGSKTWDAFTGGREGTLWYYDAVYDALAQDWNHAILAELSDAISALCRQTKSTSR